MQKRSSKIKHPRDANQVAKSIDEQATQVEPDAGPPEHPAKDEKNPAAVALGRLGGLNGGKARADKLTAKKQSATAKKAAAARWQKKSG